eukprot:gnl/TRDRNA2_/TRDRNA2_199125_c0_seq1.p1 gnl/TRDRNA2_/TRDRNA2_199125_c0~~gnl/TRDRNA2_/TRDRNA2_199125_c0_seq1.p1  ORF type:complete len:226 (-),score=28.33 gnl/TRDRNA2_/TRDRNA2_199125_c0_seq1:11-688(-)
MGIKQFIASKWKYFVVNDDSIESERFPQGYDIPWPYGTKGEWVSMDDALRKASWPGDWKLWNGDYKGKIKKYLKKRHAHLIGEGIIAPPPCWPQPICKIWEGSAAPILLLAVPTASVASVSSAPHLQECPMHRRSDVRAATCLSQRQRLRCDGSKFLFDGHPSENAAPEVTACRGSASAGATACAKTAKRDRPRLPRPARCSPGVGALTDRLTRSDPATTALRFL